MHCHAAEPDEHRIQLSDVFSTVRGRQGFKFGGDANIVHEIMINLYQGGGIVRLQRIID